MNKSVFIAVAIVITSLYSCTSSTNEKSNVDTAENKSLEDSLYKQVMAIHNEVMPKMGKVMGYQKLAQKQMDSIKSIISHTSFPTEVARRIASDVNKLDVLNDSLKAADQAMNDWMDQFDADPKMPTTEERAAYFADQKQKAEAMRTRFLQALASADSFFVKK